MKTYSLEYVAKIRRLCSYTTNFPGILPLQATLIDINQ